MSYKDKLDFIKKIEVNITINLLGRKICILMNGFILMNKNIKKLNINYIDIYEGVFLKEEDPLDFSLLD